MPEELESILKLVAEGRLTAEEAGPIVAALEELSRIEGKTGAGPGSAAAGAARARTRPGAAEEVLAGRRLRVLVVERGRTVVNLRIPLTVAGLAIDQVPGLSPDNRSRIVDAIREGLTGPIMAVSDDGNEVRIDIE
jgi:hypothetical protein